MTELKLRDIINCQVIRPAATEQICKMFGIPPVNKAVWNIIEDGKVLATFEWTFGEFIRDDNQSTICVICKYNNKFEDYVTECVYCGAKMNVYLDGLFVDGVFKFKIMEYAPPEEQHIWI